MSGGPLDFNVGEYVRRLSRALTVRGRMPLDLDGRVVPTVQIESADEAPWRDRGQQYSAPFSILAADHAGTLAGVLVAAASSAAVPRSTDVLLIDRIILFQLTQALICEYGYIPVQSNPTPIFSGVFRGNETEPHGQPSSWVISGDPSLNLAGAIPLGRLIAGAATGGATVFPIGVVVGNRANEAAPNFYLSVPDTLAVHGVVQGRTFSLPLS